MIPINLTAKRKEAIELQKLADFAARPQVMKCFEAMLHDALQNTPRDLDDDGEQYFDIQANSVQLRVYYTTLDSDWITQQPATNVEIEKYSYHKSINTSLNGFKYILRLSLNINCLMPGEDLLLFK